jgi:hypothetical protein
MLSEITHETVSVAIRLFLFVFEASLVVIFFVGSYYVYFLSDSGTSNAFSVTSLIFFLPVLFYYVFINIQHAIWITFTGYNRKELKSFWTPIVALFGVTEPDLPLVERFWGFPLRSLLYAAFLYFSFAFFQNFVFSNSDAVWATTTIQFNQGNQVIKDIDCTLLEIVDDVEEAFFYATNQTIITDFALFLGLLGDILKYRSDARVFDRTVRPALVDLCFGVTIQTKLDASEIPETAVVLLGFLVLLLPSSLMQGARRIFDETVFWVVTSIAVAVIFLSLYFLQDGPFILLALINSAPYTKTFTTTGTEGFQYLEVLLALTLVLYLPPPHTGAATFARMQREREARKKRRLERSQDPLALKLLERMADFIWNWVAKGFSLLYHLLLSQGFLVGVIGLLVTLVLAWQASGSSWPLQTIDVQAIPNSTVRLPWYAGNNEIEESALQATSLETLFTYEIQNFTQANANLIISVLNFIPQLCVPDVTPAACLNVASVLSHPVNTVAGWIESAEANGVDFIFQALQELASLGVTVLGDFENVLSQMVQLIRQNAAVLYDIYVTIENLAELLWQLLEWIWIYSPVIFAGVILVMAVLSLPFQRLSTTFYQYVLIGTGNLILGSSLLLFSLEQLLVAVGYEAILVWKPFVVILDLCTIDILLTTVLMLMHQDLYEDELYVAFTATVQVQQDITEFLFPKHKNHNGDEEEQVQLLARIPGRNTRRRNK